MRWNGLSLALSVGLLVVVGSGCGGGGGTTAHREPLTARSLYPMGPHYVWTFDIDTQTGMSSLGITRVIAMEGQAVRIAADGGEQHTYELRAEGIYRPETSTWLLRDPIAVGQEWPSTLGRTAHVTSVSEVVDVTAGHFTDCVEVVEDGGDSGLHVRTVYCQGIGPVIVESRQELVTSMTGGITVVGRLRAYQTEEEEEF